MATEISRSQLVCIGGASASKRPASSVEAIAPPKHSWKAPYVFVLSQHSSSRDSAAEASLASGQSRLSPFATASASASGLDSGRDGCDPSIAAVDSASAFAL